MFSGPVRGGTRGGQGDFKWSDVAEDKDRENYLGHSILAPVGRWQKNRDITWYNKNGNGAIDEDERLRAKREEIQRIKAAEEDALSLALGFKPAPRETVGAAGQGSSSNAIPIGNQTGAEPQDPSNPSASASASASASNPTIEREKQVRKAEKAARKAARAAKREKKFKDLEERAPGHHSSSNRHTRNEFSSSRWHQDQSNQRSNVRKSEDRPARRDEYHDRSHHHRSPARHDSDSRHRNRSPSAPRHPARRDRGDDRHHRSPDSMPHRHDRSPRRQRSSNDSSSDESLDSLDRRHHHRAQHGHHRQHGLDPDRRYHHHHHPSKSNSHSERPSRPRSPPTCPEGDEARNRSRSPLNREPRREERYRSRSPNRRDRRRDR